ncbi:MAG TPA: hypothetical protein VGY66_05565 [Gemmataceae bacterium]|jgi:hypothetical protein|nr:hypothetical protein [Gemmataceae bacterium]
MRPKGIGRDSLFQQGLQQGRHWSRQRTCQRGIHVRWRAQPGLGGVQAIDHFTGLPVCQVNFTQRLRINWS